MDEETILDVAERARYYASLSTLGAPRVAPSVAERIAAEIPSPMASAPAPRATAPADPAYPDLAAVRAWVGDCERCALSKTRTKIVFGQGNPNAELMFVGEAPGADEDQQGLAFVGRAGQLLTDIIEKGMKLRREDVFIANVLKCRPPGNRNPETDEILSCQPFLEKQIDVIRPKVLVGLGKFAGQWLLKTTEPITKIRGRVGDYKGIQAMPTYHPAYLLRNPSAKKDVWEDMKVVLSLLER
jgi:uracil-DNA glycosylase family 4